MFTGRLILRGMLLGVVAVGIARTDAADAPAAGAKPLNVLFIMSDQHHAHALGCDGNREIKTPNLDRLASRGMRFPLAFCQTGQCCPSRYTIWTGRYAHSHGLRWNGVKENLDEITIGEVFSKAGYATATIGKHHMMHDPVKHGFQTVIDMPEYRKFIKAEKTKEAYDDGDWLPYDKKSTAGPVGTTYADNDHHPAGFWANQAIAFLREHRDQPFCMWLSFYGPHVPFVASKPFADLYDADKLTLPVNFHESRKEIPERLQAMRGRLNALKEADYRQLLRFYYALTTQIDHNIGRVLTELEQLGLADNTVVVYTADHGEMMGEHGTFRKATLNYDATVRVPMIFRLPGRIPARRVCDNLVGSIDLMPTLCELAGLGYPEAVQGRSMVPLLMGKSVPWREIIFSEIGYPIADHPTGQSFMARTRDFKYVYHDNRGEPMEEFFDLRQDPAETVNQAGKPAYAAELARLKAAVASWQATDQAPLFPKANRRPRPKKRPQAAPRR